VRLWNSVLEVIYMLQSRKGEYYSSVVAYSAILLSMTQNLG
jgi:hypothetical protein